jgi:hypothetical protein
MTVLRETMGDDLKALLAAMAMAAFRREADGSFTPVASMPAWFGRLVRDPTFPFLGHILEDAADFWERGEDGFREFGPCADVNEAGREFHYRVVAVTASGVSYLLFRLDPDTERLRDVLQTVREKALAESTFPVVDASVLQNVVRVRGEDIHGLLRRVLGTAPTPEQRELWNAISSALDSMMARVDALASNARPR